MGGGRLAPWSCGLAIGLIALGGCGGPTPAEDVAPQIGAACDELQANVEELASSRSVPPTIDDISAVEDTFFDTFNALPDAETTAGKPTTVLGNSIQQLRRALFDLQGAYRNRAIDADLTGVVSELDQAIEGLNAGAAEFDLDGCIDPDMVQPHLAALVEGFEATIAAVAPTGDFALDFAAACSRYRTDVTETVLESLGDPNNQFLGPIRAAGVMDRFASDLGNFAPTPEFRQQHSALLAALQAAADSAGRITTAQTISQEALDGAIADFAAAEVEVNAAIAAIDPTC